jgi:uncharacterized protein GlcG (DUF336 family)
MTFYRKMTKRRLAIGLCMAAALAMLSAGSSLAWRAQAEAPVIKASKSSYQRASARLVIRGKNFMQGASVALNNSAGLVNHGEVRFKNSKKIFVENVPAEEMENGIDVTIINPGGLASETVRIFADSTNGGLSESDVRRIIEQAAAQATASNLKATIAVADAEGNILGVFEMAGAPTETRIGVGTRCAPSGCADLNRGLRCGLEGVCVPACAAAISKAVTGSFLSSRGHAFSTRTASFIVQEHFPPGIDFQASGPLFGVQFSQLLCSDVNPRSPLGLAADPGGIPLYKNGVKVGGVGIEGDGRYGLDPNPTDRDAAVEELVAVAASRGFEAPREITGDKIIVNGIRFPYVNVEMPDELPPTPFDRLNGRASPCVALGLAPAAIRPTQPSQFQTTNLDGLEVRVVDKYFPFQAGSSLTASEVRRVLSQAARQAFITRAAIRQPPGSAAEVNIIVVDLDGKVLGFAATPDAPMFGFDVSAQKARTAAFFSRSIAAAELGGAGFGRYVEAAAKDGLSLNGSMAISDRANGFLSRPFFPDGINDTEQGPFSVPIEEFSPFNDGLQLDLLEDYVRALLREGRVISPCTPISAPNVANGIQIFPGSVPLYKNGRLVGAIGISGDGVDQDDLIAAMGSAGFEAPAEIRADRFFVRGVRLPYVKFPRHPNR